LKQAIEEVIREQQQEQQQQQQTQPEQTFLQPPPLFAPENKTVQRSPAPVRTAEYRRPAGEVRGSVTTKAITWDKAKRDAVGWSSASD
jgi:hypothetical protein